jgi:hypothetical protein
MLVELLVLAPPAALRAFYAVREVLTRAEDRPASPEQARAADVGSPYEPDLSMAEKGRAVG